MIKEERGTGGKDTCKGGLTLLAQASKLRKEVRMHVYPWCSGGGDGTVKK